jgi:hypothetical protein
MAGLISCRGEFVNAGQLVSGEIQVLANKKEFKKLWGCLMVKGLYIKVCLTISV